MTLAHETSATTAALIDLLRQRDAHGLAKYGTTLDRTDLSLRDWLQHQVEELLDGAGYAMAAIRVITEANDAKLLAALRTVEALGYTYNGAEMWKPPIGKAPAYITDDTPEAEQMKGGGDEIIAYSLDEHKRQSAEFKRLRAQGIDAVEALARSRGWWKDGAEGECSDCGAGEHDEAANFGGWPSQKKAEADLNNDEAAAPQYDRALIADVLKWASRAAGFRASFDFDLIQEQVKLIQDAAAMHSIPVTAAAPPKPEPCARCGACTTLACGSPECPNRQGRA